MKAVGITNLPIRNTPVPKSTVPPHLALAHMFSRLATMHMSKAMANAPDKANAPLPRPDKAALNSRQPGGYQGRQPLIGEANNAYQP